MYSPKENDTIWTIICQNQAFQCQEDLLKQHEYFNALLESGFQECLTKKLIIKEAVPQDVEAMITFIKTEDISENQANPNLVLLADRFGMIDLAKLSLNLCLKKLSEDQNLKVLQFAWILNDQERKAFFLRAAIQMQNFDYEANFHWKEFCAISPYSKKMKRSLKKVEKLPQIHRIWSILTQKFYQPEQFQKKRKKLANILLIKFLNLPKENEEIHKIIFEEALSISKVKKAIKLTKLEECILENCTPKRSDVQALLQYFKNGQISWETSIRREKIRPNGTLYIHQATWPHSAPEGLIVFGLLFGFPKLIERTCIKAIRGSSIIINHGGRTAFTKTNLDVAKLPTSFSEEEMFLVGFQLLFQFPDYFLSTLDFEGDVVTRKFNKIEYVRR